MSRVNHPIALQNVVFTRSIVVAIQEFQQGDSPNVEQGPTNKLDVVPLKEQPGYYQAIMKSVLNPKGEKTSRYLIDMECVGIFFAAESLTPDEATRGVYITAHSVLYGAIRESVAWLTGRQPWGPLLLGLSVLQSMPAAEQHTATAPPTPPLATSGSV